MLAVLGAAQPPVPPAPQKHNVILFVADGLRRGSVNAQDIPTFLKVRATGVDFRNSHAVFPTFTTANASVIATGHGLGDTGDYSNTLYPGTWLGKPDVTTAIGSTTPFLVSDELLGNMNSVFNGNYLGDRTLLSIAQVPELIPSHGLILLDRRRPDSSQTSPTEGRGRVLEEGLVRGKAAEPAASRVAVSAPDEDGQSTLLEYQEFGGTRYYDRACLVKVDAAKHCQ
jgi:hypothetical protein